MSDLERLLDLQANDTASDQLHHRRATLPERAQLTELDAREKAQRASVSEPQAERDGLAREQKRIEDEIAMVEGKIASVDRQLYGEGLTSPKEAQGLQADLESLKRRLSSLEDEVLVLMEQIEPLDETLAASVAAIAGIDEERTAVKVSLAAAEASIDGEIAVQAAARGALVEAVPSNLLDEYERIRAASGGVVIAKLQGSTCQGCFLSLAAAEVDAIKRLPADQVANCPECGRMLVR